MLNWVNKKRISLIFLFLGSLTGFLYWRFVGCSTGTCPITSHWYASILYGMLLGWLVGDLIASFQKVGPKE
jgi:hypothetical protein